jgi:multidrug efflux system membrane fusion protein
MVRYLAPAANEATRSFRIELAVPNPDLSLGVGTSAQIELGAETRMTHELPPSILWLADDGTIGVKIVDAMNRARFVPVEIVESTPETILVTGLPAAAQVITHGQAYVIDGQAVVPQAANPRE